MKSWLALVKREFIEHRAGYVTAPAIIILVVTAVLVIGILMNEPSFAQNIENMPGSIQLFEAGYLLLFLMWGFYLLIALFFYFSDAFHADKRNNALLFWKSMPQSDFEILGAKALAGYTIFPLAIIIWAMISGVVLYIFANIIGMLTVFYTPPNLMAFLSSYMQISLVGAFYIALIILWHAPIFGWAGFLGTLFKRWSMPLFFIIPGLAIMLERVINIRDWGYESKILQFIEFRLQLPGENSIDFDPEVWIWQNKTIPALDWINLGLASTNWLHMVIGWAVLVVFIYLASEYRRRLLDA